jgi:hypothetical protein
LGCNCRLLVQVRQKKNSVVTDGKIPCVQMHDWVLIATLSQVDRNR